MNLQEWQKSDTPRNPAGHYKTGVELIAEERERQIEQEGFDVTHDARYESGQLIMAAVCYASVPVLRAEGVEEEFLQETPPEDVWPWAPEWWKPADEDVRNLVKAGALIAAEIDRRRALVMAEDAAVEQG